MVRDFGIKIAIILLFIGFVTGTVGQIELLQPGILFLSDMRWVGLLSLHAWMMALSLTIICVLTISYIAKKETLGQWAIWVGFGTFPFLLGVLLNIMIANASQPGGYLLDTIYVTASRHAYGTAMMMVALGGLSAWTRLKSKKSKIFVSAIFAFLISASGFVMALLQSSLGLSGMPRRYIDYPHEFAFLQFISGIAAIALFSFAAIYLVILWRSSPEEAAKIEDVF